MPNQGVMRASRGAAAGALAATVWAAQMPLDKRAVGSSFDDVELLGKLLTRGRHWRKLGWAVHIQNGALFGAGYALVSPHIPLPSWARGPAIATAENMATWPLTALSDNVHPAEDLPKAFLDARAFLVSAWRHLLFGIVLGEVERRMNASEPILGAEELSFTASSNGHSEYQLPVSPS